MHSVYALYVQFQFLFLKFPIIYSYHMIIYSRSPEVTGMYTDKAQYKKHRECMRYLHGPDFCNVGRLESIKSRDGSVKSWDCLSEIILTFVFDCLSCGSCFISHRFISSNNLQPDSLHHVYRILHAPQKNK